MLHSLLPRRLRRGLNQHLQMEAAGSAQALEQGLFISHVVPISWSGTYTVCAPQGRANEEHGSAIQS